MSCAHAQGRVHTVGQAGCAQVRGRQLLASLLHGLEHTHVEVLDCRQAVLGVRRACRLGVQRAEAGERPTPSMLVGDREDLLDVFGWGGPK